VNGFQRWALKALGLRLPRDGQWGYHDNWRFQWWEGFGGGLEDNIDEAFEAAIATADRNSVVTACIDFLTTNALAAPLVLYRGEDRVEAHPVLDLLAQPTPHATWSMLLSGLIQSLALDGNAYALRARSRAGDMAELHYIPHTAIEVVRDQMGMLSHYIYTVDGLKEPIPVEEVVHLRRAADWRRTYYGKAIVASLGPELWIDHEATRMTAAVMKNRGVPGGIIAPENDEDTVGSQEDLQATRQYMKDQFSGDKRGNWMVMGRAMKVTPFSFDPRWMDASSAHNFAEERITAAFGIPASVIGMGVGLEQTRVGATQSEQERQAWQSALIPMLRLITTQLTAQLLDDGAEERLDVDLSGVTVLQEDGKAKAERWSIAVSGGWALVSEARMENGLEVAEQDADAVYLRKVSDVEVPWGRTQEEREQDEAAAREEQAQELQLRLQNADDDEPDDAEEAMDDDGGA